KAEALGHPGRLERKGTVPRSLCAPTTERVLPFRSFPVRGLAGRGHETLQFLCEVVGSLPSILRRLGQASQDHALKGRTSPLPQPTKIWRSMDDGVKELHDRASLERWPARDQLRGNAAESEEICPRGHAPAGSLFGG